jgi:hypothetical protein
MWAGEREREKISERMKDIYMIIFSGEQVDFVLGFRLKK